MKTLGAVLGGSIGGAVGAVIWALVTYSTGYEIGWIAWGIGGLVGLGVVLGTSGRGGIAHGGTAAIIALAAVLAGKWVGVRIELSAFMADDAGAKSMLADVVLAEREEAGIPVSMPAVGQIEELGEMYPPDVWAEAERRWDAMDAARQDAVRALPPLANPQVWLVWLADEIVAEYERAGRGVDWPPGMSVETAWRKVHYPADVWAEAERRWDAMSEAEREVHRADVTRRLEDAMAFSEQELMAWGFAQSLSLFDILWIGLAVVTAAKLGGGRREAVPEHAGGSDTPPGPDAGPPAG